MLSLVPIDDSTMDSPENMILTFLPNPAYRVGLPNVATVVITDNELEPGGLHTPRFA